MGKTTIVRAPGGKRLALRHNPLAVACAAAFLLASQNAWAAEEVVSADPSATAAADTPQDPAAAAAQTEAEKEEARRKEQAAELAGVKVVGIRRGIENAIETKQDSTSIVESISAEDIGKLPDSSIAESIARLPGLTAQRDRGRATQINIRGFAGDFAGTTLNGREQTSTGDNRGVEFDQYPSELLSGVTVYKTPDASLVGQGLSGTVDLKTVRPLDFPERVLTFSYRADQNEVNGGKEYGNRYSFAYIDQFADNTFGLAIGYAHLDSPQPGFQNESWGYACGPNGSPPCAYGGGKMYKFDDNMQRDGWMASAQWRPSDNFESTLDVFYSQFDKTEIKSGVEFGAAFSSATLLPGYETNSNGTIVSSDWAGVKPVLRMDSNPIEDELFSIGWNGRWQVDDNWSITGDLSHSSTKRNFKVLETYAGLVGGGGTSNAHIELEPGGEFYNITFDTDLNDPSNLQLIDAGGWGQDGYLKDFNVEDELNAFRIDAARTFDSSWLSSVEFGLNHTSRDKEKSSDEGKLCLDACTGGDTAPFPGEPSDFGFGGIDGFAVFDAEEILADGTYNFLPNFHPDIAKKNWTASEDVTTFFVQFNIDTDIGDKPLRGNFGFQYVSTDQEGTGYRTVQGNFTGDPLEIDESYSHFLPSMNLSLGLTWEQYVRVALARQMARPRMDDLRASTDVGICTNCGPGAIWKTTSGNPLLRPWLANAFDLSYEKYFTSDAGNKGYFAAAYFYKDLQTYIYKFLDPAFDHEGQELPPPEGTQAPPLTYPATTIGQLEMPINGEGGTLKGLELSLSLPLDVLWAPLKGFGLQASYSDTKSSISPNGPGTSEPLPGLSKYVSNLTVYWEYAGFSIRASQRTRSQFRAETRGFGADLGYENFQGEEVRDAQVNYSFQPGSMFEGLSLYLQMSNIGDEPSRTADSVDSEARPLKYFEYGRTTLLGFTYKF